MTKNVGFKSFNYFALGIIATGEGKKKKENIRITWEVDIYRTYVRTVVSFAVNIHISSATFSSLLFRPA